MYKHSYISGKNISCFLLLLSFLFNVQNNALAQTDYVKKVNPMIGTGGHGHTFPGPVAPFGMVQVGPDTRIDGSWDGCSGYHYSDSIIYGFSHTHLSGTGCSDYGDILLMPVVTDLKVMGAANPYLNNKNYSSSFLHQNEIAKAGYYKVKLDKYNITAELTATTRVGMHRYQFPTTMNASIVVDLVHRDQVIDSYLEVVNDSTIRGYRRSKAWAADQRVYFYIQFSKPMRNYANGNDSAIMGMPAARGKKVKGLFTFDALDGKTIMVKVAISGVDMEGAQKNMEAELPGWNFEKCKTDCEALWNKELSKIDIKGGTADQQIVFYTALYHCFIHPSIANDVDGRYLGRDFQIHKTDGFNYYTVFSLWDTFRALHPLFNLVQRERNIDFIKTFLEQYKQVKRLPVWELSSNETECMIGYHAASVIADAYAKGNRDFDMELAMEACIKATEYDRYGIKQFHTKGFLEVEDESESVSKTLEYAYDDWCVENFVLQASINQSLHHKGSINFTSSQFNPAKAWRNMLDPETGFMRPRSNGGFYTPFNPAEVNNNYTEANAWQYSLFVPHDIYGLKTALGGDAKLEQRLDEMFSTSSKTEGRNQADITGMIGQYAHGNEPSHHMAYLYNYVNKPSKTQFRVNQILNEMYHNAPDGLSGNEDCGQMSAWYVMSAMGFYAVCPGVDSYDVTGSLLDEIRFNYNSKNNIVMKHLRTGKNDIYIDKVNTNHSINNSNFNITDPNIMVWSAPFENTNVKDSTMNFEFYYGSKPNDKPEITINHFPPKTDVNFIYNSPYNQVLAPNISANKKSFKDSLLIRIKTINDFYSDIFITENNSTKHILKKDKIDMKLTIYNSCKIDVKSYNYCSYISFENKRVCDDSAGIEANYHKIPHNWTIKLSSNYNKQYTAGGDDALIDGIRGDTSWRKGRWQGYQYQDFEAVIDLKSIQNLNYFSSTYLQDQRSWILLPTDVSYFISEDGIKYEVIGSVTHSIAPNNEKLIIHNMELKLTKAKKARYVKVKAKNFGKLPQWHIGYGDEAFIFIDEIEVK